MAQAPQPAGADGPNFVRQIVSDPKNVPDVMLLYGYLGASSEEVHERLYLSPDLSNYVEVPSSAILHRAAAAKEQDPHGGVTLWVKKDAALIYKMAPAQQAAQQALAYYFAGAIQAGAAAATPVPPQTVAQPCPPQTIIGPACLQSQAGPCPTRFGTCGATCVPQLCTQQATCRCTIDTCGCTVPPGACTQRTPCPGVSCNLTCATCFTCAPQQCTQASCGCTREQTPCSLATCAWVCTLGPACPTHGATCPPHATCAPQCTQRTPCPVVSCGIDCTIVACPTPAAPCPTRPPQATCAPLCTGAPCRPTFNQPDCPFPTEICTHVPAQCTHLPNCPRPQAAAAAIGGPVGAPPSVVSCYCQTVFGTCGLGCGDTAYGPGCWQTAGSCFPDCQQTLQDTCNYYVCVTNVGVTCYETCAACVTLQRTCNVTCHPRWCFTNYDCPIETAACPFGSAACP